MLHYTLIRIRCVYRHATRCGSQTSGQKSARSFPAVKISNEQTGFRCTILHQIYNIFKTRSLIPTAEHPACTLPLGHRVLPHFLSDLSPLKGCECVWEWVTNSMPLIRHGTCLSMLAYVTCNLTRHELLDNSLDHLWSDTKAQYAQCTLIHVTLVAAESSHLLQY